MIDLRLFAYNYLRQKQESCLSLGCQRRKLRSVGLLHNLVSDWVEGELTFWNAFHPITPSTTINVCVLHIKLCEKYIRQTYTNIFKFLFI
jgi:hypothetical protein